MVVLAVDGEAAGHVVMADTLRAGTTDMLAGLRSRGIERILLATGDRRAVAEAITEGLGLDAVRAELTPDQKVLLVLSERKNGPVMMVGDGVNDAPALARADLGIAMGSGSDVALEASDLTLVSEDLLGAVDAIRLSRRTLATIRGNLFWAFAYNVLALPLAAAGLLNPMIAGAAMAFSSVFVVSNSLRLRRFRPSPRPAPEVVPAPLDQEVVRA
jgi:Cu+-exporting ATPase